MKKEREEGLFRIVVLIVTGIIMYAWGYLTVILFIVNFFIVLFSAKRDKGIAEFCEQWNTEVYRFYRYMTFVSNERPFPFTPLVNKISKFK